MSREWDPEPITNVNVMDWWRKGHTVTGTAGARWRQLAPSRKIWRYRPPDGARWRKSPPEDGASWRHLAPSGAIFWRCWRQMVFHFWYRPPSGAIQKTLQIWRHLAPDLAVRKMAPSGDNAIWRYRHLAPDGDSARWRQMATDPISRVVGLY